MKTPNTASPWNAGWWRVGVVAACLGCWLGGRAQVANETCGHSIVPHSGVLNVGHNCVCGSIGAWGSGYGLDNGALNMAAPDFPYPTMPLACSGYVPTMTAPAADVWYYFAYSNGTADQLCLESDDTVHVSLWVGRCDSLMPWGCYTVLPFTPTSMLLPMYYYQDTLRIQVAGTSLSSIAGYEMCIEYTPGIPNTNLLQWTSPTPYTCLQYEVVVTPALNNTNPSGSIEVIALAGSPPWSITWSDNETSFLRTGLLPGSYAFTITDSIGCVQSDTVQVGGDAANAIEGMSLQHSANAVLRDNTLIVNRTAANDHLLVLDALGRAVFRGGANPCQTIIPSSAWAPGLYTLIHRTSVAFHTLRFVKPY